MTDVSGVSGGRFYAITSGYEIGVFDDWIRCAPYVIGVPGSKYKRYSSHLEAMTAFKNAPTREIIPRPGLLSNDHPQHLPGCSHKKQNLEKLKSVAAFLKMSRGRNKKNEGMKNEIINLIESIMQDVK